MNPNDRLTVRSLMLDETFAAKMQLSFRVDELEKENSELKKELKDLKEPELAGAQ